ARQTARRRLRRQLRPGPCGPAPLASGLSPVDRLQKVSDGVSFLPRAVSPTSRNAPTAPRGAPPPPRLCEIAAGRPPRRRRWRSAPPARAAGTSDRLLPGRAASRADTAAATPEFLYVPGPASRRCSRFETAADLSAARKGWLPARTHPSPA